MNTGTSGRTDDVLNALANRADIIFTTGYTINIGRVIKIAYSTDSIEENKVGSGIDTSTTEVRLRATNTVLRTTYNTCTTTWL